MYLSATTSFSLTVTHSSNRSFLFEDLLCARKAHVDTMDPNLESDFVIFARTGGCIASAVKRAGGWTKVNATPVGLRAALPNREGCRIQKHHPASGVPAYQAPSCELMHLQVFVGFRVHTSRTCVQRHTQVHMCIRLCEQVESQTDRPSQTSVSSVAVRGYTHSASLCDAACVLLWQVVDAFRTTSCTPYHVTKDSVSQFLAQVWYPPLLPEERAWPWRLGPLSYTHA